MDLEEADFPVQPRFQDDEETGEIGQREDKADRAVSEVGGEEEDDEESGEDLMKSKGNVVGSDDDEDSSEEEDDDPEEARRIAEGFIVDEDEDDAGSDEESRKRKKKERRRRKRQEEEEEENEQLDEDDLDLLAENTGIKRKQRQLKRFRRASVSPDAMEQDQIPSRKPRDLQHMFDDDDEDIVAPRRTTARAGDEYDDDDDEDLPAVGDALRAQGDRRGREPVPYNYEDEMEDFIDDDDESEMDEALSEGEREARREEKRAKRKAELEERRARRDGRFGFDPSRAGIDAEAWAELNDVFGDGQEYERFLSASEDEAEPEEGGAEELPDGSIRKTKAKAKTFEDIFEPSAIQARMMTTEDQRIRDADFPERFQVLLPGDEGESLLERRLNEEELEECTRWVSHRFSFRSNKSFLNESGEFYEYRDAWFTCVRSMVEQIINLRREAMYLYAHRIDEYELRRGDQIIDLLQRRDFSALVSACLKFKTLLARRDTLRETFNQLSEDGGDFVSAEDKALFEQSLQRTESTDEVADVADWLTMRYGQRMRDAQAKRDVTFKRPTVIGQYDQLKSTTVAPFSTKFSISSSQLAENLVGQSRAYFTEDEELTPVALADQYIGTQNGPSSVHSAIESARRLLAYEIGRDPTIKREARSLLRSAGLLSVKPTDRGQYKIDEEHPYYNFKFLLRKPIADFKVVVATEKLPSPAQYLMILRAEDELLVESELIIRETDARAFEQKLYDMYCSEGMSETSRLWNDERKQIIRQALQDHLYPAAKLWAKEWLRDECWEFIGRACEVALTKRIDCQPYQSRSMKARKELEQKQLQQPYGRDYEDDDEEDEMKQGRDNVPKVLAVSNGWGDPRKDEIEMVFLDSGGRLRERVAFETLNKPREEVNDSTNDSQQKEEKPDPSREFKQLLKERRPDAIVVSGFSPKAVSLRLQIQNLVQENVEELQNQNLAQEQIEAATIDVIHVHDDVARLYRHSERAKEEYPSLNTMSHYCLALARYAQSPVQEFAALKQEDLLALRYDAYQHLIPRERLALFLERALVAIVNTICVDINRCSIDSYYASLLRYVSGLGPRKADALMRAINTQLGGYVVNRSALTIGAADSEMLSRGGSAILSAHVWHNACSFLIIRPRQDPRTARKVKMQGSADALDRTRIHPEAYEYARFIAFDALRKTEEDRLPDQHPSQWCDELMRDEGRRAKLEDIDMADYERNLWAEMARQGQKRERKLSMLEFIARELVEPLHEQRKDFVLPTVDEVLIAFSGETRATFDIQKIVTVQVRNILKDKIIVQLESGIEGTIHKEYLLPQDSALYAEPRQVPRVNDLVKHSQTLKALIIHVDMENLRAELSARPSHIEEARAADEERRKTEVDMRYFDRELAEMERDQAEKTRQKRQNANRGTRFIRHPDFHNFKAGQAEEYLANAPRGSAVVRPSSKGDDYLAVTWKVDEGVYQHVEVQELDKDPQQEIGSILRVTNIGGSSYSDIDELLVNHVTPMARMVDILMNHEKYHGSEEELNKFLTNFSLANPTRSQYGFAIDKKRPGLFVLGFKANKEAPIQRWPVRILPGRYKLNDAEVPDMVSLCNAFKTQYTTRAMRSGAGTSNNLPGGRTPGHALPGGMTPGIGMRTGGMTPRVGGGVTPRVGGYTPRTGYSAGASRAAGAIGGATPYGSGLTAATPNPYAYGRSDNSAAPRPPGAPPMRPGPPPSRPPAYPPGPPPSKSNASSGIHPDRMRQMGQGGALNGRNGGGYDSYQGGSAGWE